MNSKNSIQVFEYQKLRVGEHGFKKKHFEAMVKFNEQNDNKYFKPIYNGIQFGSYVGVIQISGLTIEILPKADKDISGSKANKDLWQGVLLNMLKVCKKIPVDSISETKLKKRYNSILEVYFELYLQEVQQLIKKGLIKQYKKKQSNQLALKGKLLFAQNVQKNLVHKERFYCEHQVYNKNHLLHQILLQGLHILERFNTFHLQDKIKGLLFYFEQVKQIDITTNSFKNLILNRKSQPYENAINIAKMLILNYSPNINSGNENMLTLLFDMNKLWEEYIFRILYKHKPKGYEVSFQNSDFFWEHKKIKPDIVVSNTEENFVIDTKWKIVDSNNPSDDDLKQMFVYNLHWKSVKSMLLYPQISQKDSAFGNYKYKHLNNNPNQCKLGFISVLDGSALKDSKKISDEIFNKFL